MAALALWTFLTYVYQAWDAVPYLYLGGPKGSGKSRVLKLLKLLVFRPLHSSHFTGSVIFRTLEEQGGTLLYDEAEGLKEGGPETGKVLSQLLAGYQRGGGAMCNVPAKNGDKNGDKNAWEPKQFQVYGPKALACIVGLPPVLASRCITIHMIRSGPGSVVSKRRLDEEGGAWQGLRDALHALALTHGQTWLELSRQDHMVPEDIHDRNYELWQPLLALASWFEERGVKGLLGLIQQHALTAIAAEQDEQVPEEEEVLLQVLARARLNGKCPTSEQILEEAKKRRPKLFEKWTPERVGWRLRSYGLHAKRSNKERRHETPLRRLFEIQQRCGYDLGIREELAGPPEDTPSP